VRNTKSSDIEKRKSFADMKLVQVASGDQSWPFEGLPEETIKQETELSSEDETALTCNGDESKHNGNDGPTNGVSGAANGSDSEANVAEQNGEVLPDTVSGASSYLPFDPVNRHAPDLQVISIKKSLPSILK